MIFITKDYELQKYWFFKLVFQILIFSKPVFLKLVSVWKLYNTFQKIYNKVVTLRKHIKLQYSILKINSTLDL